MEPEWLTWTEAGERLGVSPHAVRARATRNGWRRQIGNDGRARVLVTLEPRAPDDRPPIGGSSPARKAADPALADALRGQLAALESHIKTLQADNEALKQDLTTTRADLSAHVASLKTENERLAGQLAGAEARAGEEAAKTAQAIRAFESLAERLEALAEARRPWWRRLVG
jgi:hypothetical protein